jgi:hypothetical protein
MKYSPNCGYHADGHTYGFGHVLVEEDHKPGRPHNAKVYVVPHPYPEEPGPRSEWKLLEVAEIAFLSALVDAIQQKDFEDDDDDLRYKLGLLPHITEAVERAAPRNDDDTLRNGPVKIHSLGVYCDLYGAVFDDHIRHRQDHHGDDGRWDI